MGQTSWISAGLLFEEEENNTSVPERFYLCVRLYCIYVNCMSRFVCGCVWGGGISDLRVYHTEPPKRSKGCPLHPAPLDLECFARIYSCINTCPPRLTPLVIWQWNPDSLAEMGSCFQAQSGFSSAGVDTTSSM